MTGIFKVFISSISKSQTLRIKKIKEINLED